MKSTFCNVFASAVLALAAAGSASAGVIPSEHNVTYTATVSGNTLDLTIDATDNSWNATQLDILIFRMAGLSGVKMMSSPTTGWTYSFEDTSGKDVATFTADKANDTFLTAPLKFSFEFTGANLDFSKLGLKATFLANSAQSDSITALNVTAAETPAETPAEVPEPASVALLLGGLGLMGAARRKAKRN